MISEEFTVSEDGGILQLNWTVSSEFEEKSGVWEYTIDYLYGEIINTTTNNTEKIMKIQIQCKTINMEDL